MVDDSDGLEEGGPLTRQERRVYLSHAYRSLFSLFYTFYERGILLFSGISCKYTSI
jgi:hypothetical protein